MCTETRIFGGARRSNKSGCLVVENRSTTGERTAPNQEGAYTNAAAISQTLSVDSPRRNSNDELQAREVNIDMQEGLQTTEGH